MPILLEDLIAKLPSDTEERVKKARDRFNTRVRDALRRETRLAFRNEENKSGGVSVQLAAGLPEALKPREQQAIDDRHRQALLLAPHRQALRDLRDRAKTTNEKLLPELKANPASLALLDGREHHLGTVSQYTDFLLQKLSEFELTTFVLKVNQDVLGVYRYRVAKSIFDEPEPAIALYWGVIGLVARDLVVSVDDLTVVVLAHELAHAYTHIGLDADNHFWPSWQFAESDLELKEGLAQYYTQLVCERLRTFSAGPLEAYRALLPHQPPAYQTHLRWKKFSAEHIRLAMLELRRSRGVAGVEAFEHCLEGALLQLQPSGQDSES